MKIQIYCLILSLPFSTLGLSAQQTLTENIWQNGLQREYIVYVPAVYDGTEPVPLMFNFHGYTGSARGQMGASGMRQVADTAGFILVFPQGSLFGNNTHWNVGSWTRGSTADDLGFTEAMIDTLAAKYNIDLNRVYSCGFSNGGYFSFELACQLSDRIAAIGAVGGKMSSETFNACNPSHPMPVVTIHGTSDNVVTYFGSTPVGSKSIAQVNEYWVNFNKAESLPLKESLANLNPSDGSTVEYSTYINGENCVSVDHYKVIGGGHDWPGSWGNKDIHASSVIWNFVSQYDLNGLITCAVTSIFDESSQGQRISFFPNPTKDWINIEMDLGKEEIAQVFSLNGSLLLSQKIGPNNKRINIAHLPSNIYVLRIGHKTAKLIIMEK